VRIGRLLVAVACGAILLFGSLPVEADELVGTVIRRIPRTEAEVIAAHAQAEERASLEIPPGQALESPAIDERVVYQVGSDSAERKDVEYLAGRRALLSFGMEISVADQANLPFLSGSTILDRVNSNYLVIEARLQRPATGGPPYLYSRPLAAVGDYANAEKTQEWAELMQSSVRDLRGVGLFVKPTVPVTAEALRTLVVINKSVLAIEEPGRSAPRLKDCYELMLVRLRVEQSTDGEERLALHVFATTDDRVKLHYLRAYERPSRTDECSIKSTIYFTEYKYANLYPSAKASRQSVVRSRETFTIAELDQYAATAGLGGDAWDHITEILDAVVDGRVPHRAAEPAPASPGAAK
jgi:hypothetical protein